MYGVLVSQNSFGDKHFQDFQKADLFVKNDIVKTRSQTAILLKHKIVRPNTGSALIDSLWWIFLSPVKKVRADTTRKHEVGVLDLWARKKKMWAKMWAPQRNRRKFFFFLDVGAAKRKKSMDALIGKTKSYEKLTS